MHPLELNVAEYLQNNDLVTSGDLGLVCVSGGADSTALLRVLANLQPQFQYSLEVIHFNHKIRPESNKEANWVQQLAQLHGMPFHLREATGDESLNHLKTGVQAAAREWRQREILALGEKIGAKWAATGHQRDDQTETRLLKLMRGCHLTSIRGMEIERWPYIRPLLAQSRSQLEAYLQDIHQDWLEDTSNQKPIYLRNRVRLEVLPLLEELTQGSIGQRLEELEVQSRRLEELINQFPSPPSNPPMTPPHWISVPELISLPYLVRESALHQFIQERHPGAIDQKHFTQALDLLTQSTVSWELHLPGKRLLRRMGQRLLLEIHPTKKDATHNPREIRVGGVTVTLLDDLGVEVDLKPRGTNQLAVYNLPPDAQLEIRSRQPGDRFTPHWRDKPIKVKEFLRDQKVPLWNRDRLPLVVWNGKIVAILPLHAAKGFTEPPSEKAPIYFGLR